jgi:hypothetical protein
VDPVVFLVAVMLGTIVLSPILGAESRPGFLRPDRKPRPMVSPMRPSEWKTHDWERSP